MGSLIRVDSQGNVEELERVPFADEVNELQGYVKRNPAILGDNITIIGEQVDTGTGKRIDMLALEEVSAGVARPVIVELKNVEADTDALLQVLRYANWALTSTDSVRLLAEKFGAKYKEIDNSSVKVIIVAPTVKNELLELSSYIGVDIDFGFLAFTRFRDAVGDLLELDWKTPILSPESITRVQKEWNWEKYERELKIGPDRIEIGKYLFDELDKLNTRQGWGLSAVFRSYYIPFKQSGRIVVSIEYFSKPCWLVIRLPKPPEELGLPKIHAELDQDYSEKYRQYSFKISDTAINVADFAQHIEKALELL